jgi:serine/threonine protein kinase
MGIDIIEIEREFRSSWRAFEPLRYAQYLARTEGADQLELLARMIGAEIEYSFQPPTVQDSGGKASAIGQDADDERIRPSLNILLAHYPALASRPDLVMRLCVLEYALRLQHDRTPPNLESYLQLCPASQDRLYQLLQRTEERLPVRRAALAPVSCGDSTVKDDSTSASVVLEPLPSNLGSFLLIDLINRGGMGVVYSAIDLRSAAQVAVKVMRRDDPWSIYRFIEEFSWLSQVSHPNLVKLYDACVEGDLRYFSMEYVKGQCVHAWFNQLRRGNQDPWSPLKKVLGQAASAIHFLHSQGVIHCDIKCSNLMITARRRAVLLDLGLAIRADSNESGLGTLQYTAPEVLTSGQHSTASDWYSFGLMIYETLSGKFAVTTLSSNDATASKRCRIDLENLRSQLTGADGELVDLCCDLLAVDPPARPRGDEVLNRLGAAAQLSIAPDHLEGRQDVLQRLAALHQQSRLRGQARAVVVRGESGIGKTSTIQHWLGNMDCRQEWIVCVHCFRQDQTPLRLLNGLAQQLVQLLGCVSRHIWHPSLARYLDSISATFPQVRQLVDVGLDLKSRVRRPAPLNENPGVHDFMHWLIELNAERRFLIFVDDAQWADTKSLGWLGQLIQHPQFCGMLIAVDESPGADEGLNGPVASALSLADPSAMARCLHRSRPRDTF